MVKNCLLMQETERDGFHPWVGKIPREGNGNPLQYSCLEIQWTEELVGYSAQGHKGLDMTEVTQHALQRDSMDIS